MLPYRERNNIHCYDVPLVKNKAQRIWNKQEIKPIFFRNKFVIHGKT